MLYYVIVLDQKKIKFLINNKIFSAILFIVITRKNQYGMALIVELVSWRPRIDPNKASATRPRINLSNKGQHGRLVPAYRGRALSINQKPLSTDRWVPARTCPSEDLRPRQRMSEKDTQKDIPAAKPESYQSQADPVLGHSYTSTSSTGSVIGSRAD
jgi:hypothetical protein